jgi:hypothetical protein
MATEPKRPFSVIQWKTEEAQVPPRMLPPPSAQM